jgi:dephospho-CoA kinase
MRIWGLTGGIASGKSLAARYFEEEGIPVIDADLVARELSAEGGAAHEPILKRFGTADRSKLRALVFADANARKDLEAILHPLIQAESLRRARKMAEKTAHPESFVVLYEASLLVETGRYRELDGLILVTAPEEIRLRRLLERDRLEESLAREIMKAQLSDEKKAKAATLVLTNDGSAEELRDQVRKARAELWGA